MMMVAGFPVEDDVTEYTLYNSVLHQAVLSLSELMFLRQSVLYEREAGHITPHRLQARRTALTGPLIQLLGLNVQTVTALCLFIISVSSSFSRLLPGSPPPPFHMLGV